MDWPETRKEDLYKSWGTGVPCPANCDGELLATLAIRTKYKGIYHYRCDVCDENGIWEDLARKRRGYSEPNRRTKNR